MGIGQQIDTTDFHVAKGYRPAEQRGINRAEADVALVIAILLSPQKALRPSALVILGDLGIQGNIGQSAHWPSHCKSAWTMARAGH